MRFRYVTNDQYRKVPHEGFYVDDFSLSSTTGTVRYISGWQKLSPDNEPGTYVLRPTRSSQCYLRIARTGECPGLNKLLDLYRLVVSKPRALSWAEMLRRPRGLASVALALFGLLLSAVSSLLWSRSQPEVIPTQ